MLSPKTIEIVKQITPAVAPHAEAITRVFYERMFRENPEVQAYFNSAHQHTGGQQRALAGAICAYFVHIDDLAALGPAVELIAQKHCSLGIQPEHYPIVGKHLLAAIGEVLGDAVTPEVVEAVTEAYQFLAQVFIDREAQIYKDQRTQPGGWNGYREFIVDRKQPESDVITSFYLRPADDEALPPFQPGQYITLRVDHPTSPTSPRNYSLSDRPGLPHYRISVKREPSLTPDGPDGLISSHLHDTIQPGDRLQVGPPCGEFVLEPGSVSDEPIVLIAGGVGATPLLSMLKSSLHAGLNNEIIFIQAARNHRTHAFRHELEALAREHANLRVHVIYDQPDANHKHASGLHLGTVDTPFLKAHTPYEQARFYFCGPKPFMAQVIGSLVELGVGPERFAYEFFGPRQDLEAVAAEASA